MEKLKVGIVGVGMVGGALARYFLEKKKYKRGNEMFLFDADSKKGYSDSLASAQVIFVSVPTPTNPKDGSCDIQIVEKVVAKLAKENVGVTVVIKSTVPPGTTDYLQKKFSTLVLLFNPEFLTEKNAWQDMINPDRQIVGFTKGNAEKAKAVLSLLPKAQLMSPGKDGKVLITAAEAEMIKYAGNVYLSRKVVFANALAKAAERVGADYGNVRLGMGGDPRIGKSHLDVDYGGYRGFGGYCFPKDTAAFIAFAKDKELEDVYDLIMADWVFNEKLLAEQGLTVEEVSKHDADVNIVRREK